MFLDARAQRRLLPESRTGRERITRKEILPPAAASTVPSVSRRSPDRRQFGLMASVWWWFACGREQVLLSSRHQNRLVSERVDVLWTANPCLQHVFDMSRVWSLLPSTCYVEFFKQETLSPFGQWKHRRPQRAIRTHCRWHHIWCESEHSHRSVVGVWPSLFCIVDLLPL